METTNEKLCLNCGEPYIALREAKKYCSDSCRQLAFYKRTNAENKKEGDVEELQLLLNNLETDIVEDKNTIKQHINNVSDAVNEEDNVEATITIITDKKTVQEHTKYEQVNSYFIEELHKQTEDTEMYLMFTDLQQHWNTADIERIKYISTLFRCLLENVIRLSSEPQVPKKVIRSLSSGFLNIIEAEKFKFLPKNY